MQSINNKTSLYMATEASITESLEQKKEKKAEKEIIEEKQRSKEQKKENFIKNDQRLEKEKIGKEDHFSVNNEKEKSQNNQWKVKKTNKKISAASYMMRLANASTPVAVSGVLRSARAEQSEVKRSGASKQEIAKALAILKRVIASGNRKIAGLKKEERMENLRRAMKGNHNYKEEERIRKEIKKQKRARKAREIADMADPEEVIIHDHDKDFLCPNELSTSGLFRDLSNALGSELNLEIGADMGICTADVSETVALDVTI